MQVYGFQNSPLITADPNGSIGITVAGYFAIAGTPYVQGMVQHFEVSDSSSSWTGRARQLAPVPPRLGPQWLRRRR